MITREQAEKMIKEREAKFDELELFEYDDEWWAANIIRYTDTVIAGIRLKAPGSLPVKINKKTGEYRHITVFEMVNGSD